MAVNVELNATLFNSRLKRILDVWKVLHLLPSAHKVLTLTFSPVQSATANDEFSSIVEADALLLLAGDLAGEDEPIRKGTAFQVRADRTQFHFASEGICGTLAADLATGLRIPIYANVISKRQSVHIMFRIQRCGFFYLTYLRSLTAHYFSAYSLTDKGEKCSCSC